MPIPINDLNRHTQPIREALDAAIRRVLDRAWYVHGPELEAFEAAWAGYCGVTSCVGVGNGTDALELALRAAGVGPGDEVATVANAGMYSTTAIRAIGADPLYVDIDPATFNMDPAALAASIGPRTRAVIATHLYGRMAPMPALLASARGLPVIEDCAQAHGAELDGRRAGAWGASGCFSFYPTKNLGALGDGGAVVTSDAEAAQRLRRLRQYGWRRKYDSAAAGARNSRLDEIQAAVLLAKLPHLDEWNRRRLAIARRYAGAFEMPGPEGVAHLFVIRAPRRDETRSRLEAGGVQTDVHYPIPDHLQESQRGLPWRTQGLAETERAANEVLTLPCFPELTDEEAARVIAAYSSR